jgi:hypothetical protein
VASPPTQQISKSLDLIGAEYLSRLVALFHDPPS